MRHLGVCLLLQIALSLSLAGVSWAAPQLPAGTPAVPTAPVQATPAVVTTPSYMLGPDDVIAIKALDADEISNASIRIDPTGHISLPLLGRVAAGGLTVQGLEQELNARLKTYVKEPAAAVTVVEYRSQPVSVLGAVGQPGVHQLEGRKTLVEILAKAGGLRPEAGNIIKITRRTEAGPIPLPAATTDQNGFSVAEVNLRGIMQATRPEENILIQPNDVISVPRADLVYVIGEVKKPGGFILYERGSILSLQALAMAEGLTNTASPQRAVIIRRVTTPEAKQIEIAANLKDILSGKSHDLELLPEDILFIPNSAAKAVAKGVISTAISAATSAFIYRGFY